MDRIDRRRAAEAYKESRKTAGVYAVRCEATGETWVGRSADLAAQRNSFDFQQRHGPNNPAMRTAWSAHGPASLRFEALETAPEELTPAGRSDFLKRRWLHWRESLGAGAV